MSEEEKVIEGEIVNDKKEQIAQENKPQPTSQRWNIYDTLGMVGFGLGIEAAAVGVISFLPYYGLILGPIGLVCAIVGLVFEIKAKENSPARLRPLKVAGYYVNLVTIIVTSIFIVISILLSILTSLGIIGILNTNSASY